MWVTVTGGLVRTGGHLAAAPADHRFGLGLLPRDRAAPEPIPLRPTAATGTGTESSAIAELVRGVDAVISAWGPRSPLAARES